VARGFVLSYNEVHFDVHDNSLAQGVRMTGKKAVLLGISVIAASLLAGHSCIAAQRNRDYLVRLAELEINPAQLDAYRVALKEEIETSIRLEPGVLRLYAVSVKGHPEQIRLFETYKDEAAYQSHLQSPHFKAYKDKTQSMVKGLRLIEVEPVLLGSK
jgi:quinol monooxygenase YgiN